MKRKRRVNAMERKRRRPANPAPPCEPSAEVTNLARPCEPGSEVINIARQANLAKTGEPGAEVTNLSANPCAKSKRRARSLKLTFHVCFATKAFV